MRLFLLPIASRRTLIYCDRASLKSTTSPQAPPSLVDKLTTKATTTWASWERAEGGWKKKLTVYGDAVLRRIPYEEWGLKSIPALTAKAREERKTVEVIFPGTYLKPERVGDVVRKLALERQGLHRKRMIWSLIGAPLTLPCALVPVIPNIPGFYLLFRAWSHWKALSGAKHLEFVIQNNLVKPTPSPILDELYTAGLLHPTRKESRAAPIPTIEQGEQIANSIEQKVKDGPEDVMLLKGWNGKLIAERFEIPDLEVEIERAVEQVEKAVLKPKDAEKPVDEVKKQA